MFILIGVQNTEGEYLINLPTWSKTIEAAGTTITYIHEDNRYADRIYIPGPIQYELNLMVWFSALVYNATQNDLKCCKSYSILEIVTVTVTPANCTSYRLQNFSF